MPYLNQGSCWGEVRLQKSKFEQETRKICRGAVQKPEGHDLNFSWLHVFLLKHILSG